MEVTIEKDPAAEKEELKPLVYRDTIFTLKPLDLELFNKYQTVKSFLLTWEDAFTRGIDLKRCSSYREQIKDQQLIIESFTKEDIEKDKAAYDKAVQDIADATLQIMTEWQNDSEAWDNWSLYQDKLLCAQEKVYSEPQMMKEFIESAVLPVTDIKKLDWKSIEMLDFIKAVMSNFFTSLGSYK